MRFVPDRRDHKRFDMGARECRLCWIRESGSGFDLANCTLVNLSYGGMCFRAPTALREQEEHQFLLDLKLHTKRLALVRVRICWVEQKAPAEWVSGAVFTESSMGWTGPEEESN